MKNFRVHLAALTALCVAGVLALASGAAASVGDGTPEDVDNDNPADAWGIIRDFGTENAPTVIAIIGGLFLVGFTFHLVRRGLMKAQSKMRL